MFSAVAVGPDKIGEDVGIRTAEKVAEASRVKSGATSVSVGSIT